MSGREVKTPICAEKTGNRGMFVAKVSVSTFPEEKSPAVPMERDMVSTFLKMMRASTRSVVKNFEAVGHALDTRNRSRSVEVLAEMKGAVAELQQVLGVLEERLDQPGGDGSNNGNSRAPGVENGAPVHCEDMWISMLGGSTDHQRRSTPNHDERKAAAEAAKLRRQVQVLQHEKEDLQGRCKALLQRLEASEALSLRDQREKLAAARERFEKEAAEEKEKLQRSQDKLRRRERALKDMLRKAIEEVHEMRPSPSAGEGVSRHSNETPSSLRASAAERGGTLSASMEDCSWLMEAHQGIMDALTPASGASAALPQHDDACASAAGSPRVSELSLVSSISTPRVLATEEALRLSEDLHREQEEEEEEGQEEEEGWSRTPLSSSSPIEAAVPASSLHSRGSKMSPAISPADAAAEASFMLAPAADQGAADEGFHPRRSMSPALPTTGSPGEGLMGSGFLFSIPTTVSAGLQHSTVVDRTMEDVSACCIGSVADVDDTGNSLSADYSAAMGSAADASYSSPSARPTTFAFWVPPPSSPSKSSTHSQSALQTSSTFENDSFQRVIPKKGRSYGSKARHVALPAVDLHQEPPRTPTDVRALKRDLADEMQVFDKRTLLGLPSRHATTAKTKNKGAPLRAKEVNTLRSSRLR